MPICYIVNEAPCHSSTDGGPLEACGVERCPQQDGGASFLDVALRGFAGFPIPPEGFGESPAIVELKEASGHAFPVPAFLPVSKNGVAFVHDPNFIRAASLGFRVFIEKTFRGKG